MIKLEVDRRDIGRIDRVLQKLPVEVQFSAYDKALRPAARVVVKRAEQLAPRSSQTGTRDKMSSKSKAIWSPIPTAKLFVIKVLKGRKAAKVNTDPYAMVGPKFPEGNKANFVHPMKKRTKRQVYWGKSSKVGTTLKDNDFLKRAADETRAQQLRAFLRALIPDVRKRMEKLAKSG